MLSEHFSNVLTNIITMTFYYCPVEVAFKKNSLDLRCLFKKYKTIHAFYKTPMLQTW